MVQPRRRGSAGRVGRGLVAGALALCGALACTGPAVHSGSFRDPNQELEAVWLRYQPLLGPKALAIAFDGEAWAYGLAYTTPTSDEARRRALEDCERRRRGRSVSVDCSIYAVDDRVVWTLDDAVQEFKVYPGHKALWVAGDPSWHMFGSTLNQSNPEEAIASALEDCRSGSEAHGLAWSCRICVVDEGVACTLLEPGW